MKSWLRGTLMLCLAAAPVAHAQDAAMTARQTLNQALGAISQAEGKTARALVASINAADLPEAKRALPACIAGRLDAAAVEAPGKTVADTAVGAYRRYWLDAAMGQASVADGEERLRNSLVALLRLPADADWDVVEPALEAAIKAQGYGVLLGRTGRLRELMIWTQVHDEQKTVTLPEGAFTVKVTYLDRFASLGWSRWLSCDAIGTGGWAKTDGLYAVVPAYPSLDDELFRLSFLGHETQHFSDYQRFPELKPWELEYRAKLVELVYAERISPMLLRGFGSATGNDPADSHAYANGRVIAELKARLGVEDLTAVPLVDIQRTAKDALLADSKGRSAG